MSKKRVNWIGKKPNWYWRYHVQHCTRYNATENDTIVNGVIGLIKRFNTIPDYDPIRVGLFRMLPSFGHPRPQKKTCIIAFQRTRSDNECVIEVVSSKQLNGFGITPNRNDIVAVIVHCAGNNRTEDGIVEFLAPQLTFAQLQPVHSPFGEMV